MKSVFLLCFTITFIFSPIPKAFAIKVQSKKMKSKIEEPVQKESPPPSKETLDLRDPKQVEEETKGKHSKEKMDQEQAPKPKELPPKPKELSPKVKEPPPQSKASIPHVLQASTHLKSLQYTPFKRMRVFAADSEGTMRPIPYQFDQKDDYGDYVFDMKSNAFLDDLDELCFMSEDVGEDVPPKTWSFQKPDQTYKVLLTKEKLKKAVYVGVYKKSPPPESLSSKTYVTLDMKTSQVETDMYRYLFNQKNYLMVKDFYVKSQKDPLQKLLSSSTFYLKLNLKYFFSISINHNDINSDLEEHKVGPVRAIARVNFNYKIMAMKIDLGMYTEVVFFKNAIFLPAIMENPIDAKSLLNKDSDFYYGFAMIDNPKNFAIESNMSAYPETNASKAEDRYWFSSVSKGSKQDDYQIYLEFEPSTQMVKDNIKPRYFVDNQPAKKILKRTEKPRPPGKSRANEGIIFPVEELQEGEHEVKVALFVDNTSKADTLASIRSYRDWEPSLSKLETKAPWTPKKTQKKPTESPLQPPPK